MLMDTIITKAHILEKLEMNHDPSGYIMDENLCWSNLRRPTMTQMNPAVEINVS